MTERTSLNPDPAGPEDLQNTVSQQGLFLELLSSAVTRVTTVQEDTISRIRGMNQALSELTERHANPAIGASTPSSGNNAASASGPVNSPENFRLQPEPFLGNVEACGGFLLQCQLIFQQAPRHYHSDISKITLIINFLRKKALRWAQAFVSANPISHLRYEHFLNEFRLIFDQPRKREEATRKLLNLKQHNRTVSEHVIDFRILAVEAGCPQGTPFLPRFTNRARPGQPFVPAVRFPAARPYHRRRSCLYGQPYPGHSASGSWAPVPG
uniref:Ty3 transposon capsid-like protein domain-containing protein n=1 Tax=Oryzias latipes TaxID=8090 RepID=A0A3B3HBS1_ORYLA